MSSVNIEVPGTEVGTALAIETVSDYCLDIGFDELARFQIKVVVAEALNNIVEHALREPARELVGIACHSDGVRFTIDISDKGAPLNHTPGRELPDLREESGRGWPIIFSWMDEVSLSREGDVNNLTLTKLCKPICPPA